MSHKVDVSILIVHATGPDLVRHTLRGIRRSAPRLSYEVIVVDNASHLGLGDIIRRDFQHVKYIQAERNWGFGKGMNIALKEAVGEYILIFNPDIIMDQGSLESMYNFMKSDPSIGICGPRLYNPNGTLQYSCFRQPTLFLPALRRTPLGKIGPGKKIVDHYLMKEVDHENVMDVDSVLGGAMLTRRDVLNDIGVFDERFFMYYEDNDICRRAWEKGYRVVYFPESKMMHYYRRLTADGGLIKQVLNYFTWVQISSFIKYMIKYYNKPNPRVVWQEENQRKP